MGQFMRLVFTYKGSINNERASVCFKRSGGWTRKNFILANDFYHLKLNCEVKNFILPLSKNKCWIPPAESDRGFPTG